MKFIKNNYATILFAGIMMIGLGFSGCDADEEDPVTPKTLEQYLSETSSIVNSELSFVQNCVVGYNTGNFRNASLFEEYSTDYMNALNTAKDMLAATDLTIADVMDANYLISSPGKRFNDEIFQSDRTQLDETIRYCDTLRVNTPIGGDPGMASQEAHDQFGAAISTARGVRTRMTAIDRQIAEADENLNGELVIFEDEIVK